MEDNILLKVSSHCGKIGYVIDTCYKKHGFPSQFKFKNHKADCNNNQQNHEGSRLEVHSSKLVLLVSSIKHC